MYKQNTHIAEQIKKHGIEYGLPLFEQTVYSKTHPMWLFNGNAIKAEVYNKMKTKFAEDSFLYLGAVLSLGGSATDHEVKEYFNDIDKWPLHIVSARRNYLVGNPYYVIESFPGETKTGPKGKPNTIWFVNYSNLYKTLFEA